ncbi:hypothetical protein QN397_15730 [Variovorax sp. RTB1]|uniref:hypothetical protein n=1 Tax=Variovorax sp. RTB1 TaxID=3048631 RepID=UPI002B23AD50|nr:hypothetical protein [Variovorax sp. RTB1]MEB0112807.1 hypothetical protein [Variovorax sp. RTB1]
MITARLRRLVATHFFWWCLAGVLLSALQPFLFTHFCQDGWEDEPGFRMALVSLLLPLAIALLRWLFPPDASLASAFRIPAARPRARLSTPLFRLRIS